MSRTKNTQNEINSSFFGFIDQISDEKISGWILDRNSKNIPEIEMYLDGALVDIVRPTVIRSDLNLLYGANRETGFSIKVNVNDLISGAKKLILREKTTGFYIHPIPELKFDTSIYIDISAERRRYEIKSQQINKLMQTNSKMLLAANLDPEIREKVDPSIGNIHIINGIQGTASELFRAYALANSLKFLGFTPLIFNIEDLKYLNTNHLVACFFIRVSADSEVIKIINRLKTEGVKIVSDFDDLIFRPSLMNKIDGVRFLTKEEKDQYRTGMYGYRQMIRESDYVITTTNFLSEQIAENNKNVLVVKNYPLKETTTASEKVFLNRNKKELTENKNFTIAYYSGTLTHQADFRICAPAIYKFIKENNNTRLRIVGAFNISEFTDFDNLRERIDHLPLMSYEKMIEDMEHADVIIAPLEIGNEFCESKSELKFFDAALCGIPVIASKTRVFSEVIEHGKNGLLANNAKDWLDALNITYLDRSFLKNIGINAKNYVELHYSNENRHKNYAELINRLNIQLSPKFFEKKIVKKTNKKIKNNSIDKRLTILLPDIMIGSGGHRKALTFCSKYEQSGGRVEVLFMSNRSDTELRHLVHTYYFSNISNISVYDGIEPECDLAVATSWTTAYEVYKWPDNIEKYYFVQDFEPMFNPMSTDYVRAYHSYRLGLNIVTFGRWNKLKLKQEFSIDSKCIDFPVDKEVYYPMMEHERKNIILFYARPSQPRRLYQLGFDALNILRPHLQEWEIIFFGEEISDLPQGFTSIGKVTDLNELCQLYSEAKLGIAFSSTNPSLMPFEMLSCGLPIIDIDIGYLGSDFEGCKAITFSIPTPEKLAQEIYSLISNPAKLDKMSIDASEWARKLPSDDQYATNVLKALTLI